jgi:hypothetical protein
VTGVLVLQGTESYMLFYRQRERPDAHAVAASRSAIPGPVSMAVDAEAANGPWVASGSSGLPEDEDDDEPME